MSLLRKRPSCVALIALLTSLLAYHAGDVLAVDLLLNSWETPDDPLTDPTNGGVDAPGDPNYNWGAREELEGWQDSFGGNTIPASVSVVSGMGNTDGSNALQFTLDTNGFEWAIDRFLCGNGINCGGFIDPQFNDFVTALANPAFHRIDYDVTYDLTWANPDPGSSFFNIGISISLLEGAVDDFHQGFGLFGVGADEIIASGGNITGTATVGQQLSAFSNLPFQTDPIPGFIRPIIPVNGNWDAPATFIIDNLRISENPPPEDLNGDLALDLDDFDIFMMWHKSDFTGLDAATALARGDFDQDFDSDFDDYLIFESTYNLVNGSGRLADDLANIPEPASAILLMMGLLLTRPIIRSLRSESIC